MDTILVLMAMPVFSLLVLPVAFGVVAFLVYVLVEWLSSRSEKGRR